MKCTQGVRIQRILSHPELQGGRLVVRCELAAVGPSGTTETWEEDVEHHLISSSRSFQSSRPGSTLAAGLRSDNAAAHREAGETNSWYRFKAAGAPGTQSSVCHVAFGNDVNNKRESSLGGEQVMQASRGEHSVAAASPGSASRGCEGTREEDLAARILGSLGEGGGKPTARKTAADLFFASSPSAPKPALPEPARHAAPKAHTSEMQLSVRDRQGRPGQSTGVQLQGSETQPGSRAVVASGAGGGPGGAAGQEEEGGEGRPWSKCLGSRVRKEGRSVFLGFRSLPFAQEFLQVVCGVSWAWRLW